MTARDEGNDGGGGEGLKRGRELAKQKGLTDEGFALLSGHDPLLPRCDFLVNYFNIHGDVHQSINANRDRVHGVVG